MLAYFKSKEFFLSLAGLIGLAVVGYLFIFYLFLPAYTRHGKAVVVPRISNMHVEEAIKELQENKLKVEVRDSIYQAGVEPLSVIRQYPLPYSRVKKNRTVYLTINQTKPPTVEIPKLVNLNLYQAKMKAEAVGLIVNKVEYVPYDAHNTVMKVFQGDRLLQEDEKSYDEQQGIEVAMGTKISFIVGKKSEAKVAIPDLINKTHAEAMSILRGRRLQKGSVIYNEDGPESLNGRIYDQSPRPVFGDSIRQGHSVDLFIYGSEEDAEILEGGGAEEGDIDLDDVYSDEDMMPNEASDDEENDDE